MRIRSNRIEAIQGNVLVATLCVTVIVGLALVGYLRLASGQNQLVTRSQVWNFCMPVIEAGIEEALTHCNENYLTNMVSSGWQLVGKQYTKTNWLGETFYHVRISTNLPYEIHATGFYPMPGSDGFVSRTVRVRTRPRSIFNGAVLVRNTINMNGNNVLTDSYDSRDTTKSTLGKYDPLKAGDKGDVACIEGLVNSFNVGNANIWGHIYTAPSGTVNVGPNGAVGSTAFQKAGKSGIESGWWLNDFSAKLENISTPFTTGATPGSGSGFTYVLDSKEYVLSSLTGKVLVTGNATVYVTGDVAFKSGDLLEISAGASLKLYVAGADATFSTIVNFNGAPGSFSYFGLPSNKTMKLQGSASLTAAIYAPETDVTLVGGSQLFGSIVAKSAVLTGHSAVHYDEALRDLTPFPGIAVISWDEL